MEHLVIVRNEGPNRYSAQALGIPQLRAEAATESEALEQLRASLADWLRSAKLVRVQVTTNGTGNPWLDSAGRSADDPQWEEYREELRRARAREEGEVS